MKTQLFVFALMALSFCGHAQVWHADVSITAFNVQCINPTTVSYKISVKNGGDDDARNTQVVLMLPVEVIVKKLPDGCSLHGSQKAVNSTLPEVHASVVCHLGQMKIQQNNSFEILSTKPNKTKEVGVVIFSETPDSKPSNNFMFKNVPCN